MALTGLAWLLRSDWKHQSQNQLIPASSDIFV